MNEWIEKLVLAWIPLFVALDPLGLVPLFEGMAFGIEKEKKKIIVSQATWTAAVVAAVFMFLGNFIFKALGITVADFHIAGGLILFVLATRDLVGIDQTTRIRGDFGVVPLGTPLIAGPATLTTLLILMKSSGISATLTALAINLVLVNLAFRNTERLTRLVGMTGLKAVSKIISLLLVAIAVNMIRRGLQAF